MLNVVTHSVPTGRSSDLIARAVLQAGELAIFLFGRDPGYGIGDRKGRIPADADRFARFARCDARILNLRETFERIRKFIVELGGAEIALAREDRRAAGALVVAVAVGEEIAGVAIEIGREHV